MCLGRIEKFETNGKGWKKIIIRENKYQAICCIPPYIYKKRKWNKDENGFYIFATRKDARKSFFIYDAIKRVEYRKVIDTGYHMDSKVVVAKEFRFID